MTTMWTQRTTTAAAALAMAAALGLGVSVLQAQGRGGQAAGQQGGGRGGAAQQPARDAQTQPATPATGVISGTVTLDGAGTPVRRARVTLSGAEVRGGRSTITNDDGAYAFPALPAGRYTITASKAGYVNVPYGAKKPGRPGTPIQLADGMKMEKADISLPKGGVITGIVVDDNGEPTPRTQVRVLRYVMRTGERTLQQAGSDLTDDRGMYRIYGLQPGDYLVSAVPQNLNVSDIRQTIAAEVEALLQQVNTEGLAAVGGRGGAAGGGGGRGGRGGAAGVAGIDLNQILGGGRGGNPAILGRVQQLQDQLAQQDEEQATAYAPVYYPGTPMPSTASPVSLAIAEERGGVDFRLMLVPTARVEGTIASPTGQLPQGTQITLMPLDQDGMPPIAGANNDNTRVGQDGAFSFRDIPPGQYRVMARGAVRQVDPNAPAGQGGGRGGRGGGGFGGRGGGQIAQVLWGAADISVNGEDVTGVTITLQDGMTVTGRITFETSTGLPPTDMSNVRVNLSPRGAQQGLDVGGVPPAEVDASGRFTIKGVLPGKYTISANVPGGGGGGGGGRGGRGGGAAGVAGAPAAPTVQWVLKSAVANGLEALDFGLAVEPNQNVNATILFSDKNQQVSGTIQDMMGNPTADYTVVLFASDKAYWVPQSRRIQASRPGTDGKFSFRNLPAGNYSLTAVTDVEPGEWFDPAFLEQLVNASIPVVVRDGETKTQDIKVASGG